MRLKNRIPYVDAYAGKDALELVLAIYKSQKEGQAVTFPLTDFLQVPIWKVNLKRRKSKNAIKSDFASYGGQKIKCQLVNDYSFDTLGLIESETELSICTFLDDKKIY